MTARIELPCPACGIALSFEPTAAGQSGPCYGCGAAVTVPSAPAQPLFDEVPPRPIQMSVLEQVRAQAGYHGVRALGTKVTNTVAAHHRPDAGQLFAMWAGGELPIQQIQSIKLVTPGGDALFVFVAWHEGRQLMHELASLLPGTLGTNLRLRRSSLGVLFAGTFEGDRGEQDPTARAAAAEEGLADGIVWDWAEPRRRIPLAWGLQAVPFSANRTLHVMHSGGHDVRVGWYLEKRLAFVRFMRKLGNAAPPAMRFDPQPLAAAFLGDVTER